MKILLNKKSQENYKKNCICLKTLCTFLDKKKCFSQFWKRGGGNLHVILWDMASKFAYETIWGMEEETMKNINYGTPFRIKNIFSWHMD